jgi:hypothetical protein
VKTRIPPKLQPWFDARRRLGLSHATVQMARELGMNPRHLDKLVPSPAQRWKAPLPEFVAECYAKAHGRRSPERVLSLEQLVAAQEQKKELRRTRRGAGQEASPSAEIPATQPAAAPT